MTKSISFIINPSELGAGTRGASLGPFAMQIAAREKGNQLFKNRTWTCLSDFNHLLDRPIKFPLAKRIDGMVKVYETIGNEISKTLSAGNFPFVIAGDHASAGGTIRGIHQAYPDARLGVIWIDAHADVHTPYTTPSGNLHGMPIATALGMDNLACEKNHVDLETSLLWNQLKCSAVKPADLVYIAVRDTEPEEDQFMNDNHIKNFTVDEVRSKGVDVISNETLGYLNACDLIYVSFDVDSMDPDLTSYGTGTPVKNGLTMNEAVQLLQNFSKTPKLCALEVVEVNPCLDKAGNKMAEIALEIVDAVAHTLEESWKL
ncbi:MAG: arginase [Flavobacteriia bacterium]|jgi:arginase|nr:arginase [Flavobacteriia bacterium]NBV92019.1 arginase [Flavobacteriia bacterium]